MVLFWKLCDSNKKFLFHVLKTGDVLDIIAPIVHHINNARLDQGTALLARTITQSNLVQVKSDCCTLASTFCCC